MGWEQVLTIIGSILIPMFGGLFWLVSRMDKKFDKIDIRFKEIDEEIGKINTELKLINARLSSLEGAFFERGQWEGRMYSMQKKATEEKK